MPTKNYKIPSVNVTRWLHMLARLLPITVITLVSIVILVIIVRLVLQILNIRRLCKQKPLMYELIPLAHSDKAPIAMEQLFSVLHGLKAIQPLLRKLALQNVTFSLEDVSTREQGIRFLLRVAEKDAHVFEHDIMAYSSDLKFQVVDDYMQILAKKGSVKRFLEFKLTGDYAYPLQTLASYSQRDPATYITQALTKLKPEELVSFQVVVTPANVRAARALSARIANNEELLFSLGKRKMPGLQPVFTGINSVLFAIMGGIGEAVNGPSSYYSRSNQRDSNRKLDIARKVYPARSLSPFEQQLAESVHGKLTQPLFHVNIRAMVVAGSKADAKRRVDILRNSLQSLSVPEYQSLKSRFSVYDKYRQFAFKNRLPSVLTRNSCLLSAPEIANMYHFPHSETNKTENMTSSLARSLPAPVSLKNGTKFDIILGRNNHQGSLTEIGLTAAERERHMYIVGGTGNGKTTLMEYMVLQDIKNGKGVAVIDPHGDMAEKILKYIPEERLNDVIYFNPDDVSNPIGLNLLEIPEELTGDDILKAQDFATEAIVSIFRKIFSDDDTGGHRIENTLRYAIHTAFTVEGANLFTVKKLLVDPDFRKTVVDKLDDEDIKDFWNKEFGLAGNYQKYKKIDGVTTKIGRFQLSVFARRCLEQTKSTINFDDILNGKILICNLAKGHIVDDTSEMFGTTILAKLHLAAYRRIHVKPDQRIPFYLYVDEFQNFATPLFVQILSEARKYRLFVNIAEQSTSQQDDDIVENILGNSGVVTCFRTDNPADEKYMLHIFNNHIKPGEISNLSAYNFYMKITANKAQEPFSGETLLPEGTGSDSIAEKAVKASRANYSIKYEAKPKAVKEQGKSAATSKTHAKSLKKPNTDVKPKDKGKKPKK